MLLQKSMVLKNLSPVMSEKTKEILKLVFSAIIGALTAILGILGLQSCNVTRVVSTKAESYKSGDSTITIVTKTTESYDAKKTIAY